MSLLNNFDIEKHFWREFPQFKVLSPFKELYKNDKSRDKVHSSQKMWAIAFICDPSKNNPYRNLSDNDKKTLLSQDWLKDPSYDWSELDDCVKFYNKCLLTPEQKSIIAWKEKMEERDQFLANTKYTLENGEKLDKIVANTPKLYEQLKQLETKLEHSESGDDENKVSSLLDSL